MFVENKENNMLQVNNNGSGTSSVSTKNKPNTYGGKIYPQINGNKYTNARPEVKKFNGTFGHAIAVGYNETTIGLRTHQSRVRDTDIGHVAALAEDIKNVGMKESPYIEWDAVNEKWGILVGHSRFLAVTNKLGRPTCDCRIVGFNNPIDREEFIQHKNNHQLYKLHH